tara:strand:- start:91 stop:363 length:273 start_codon:yes stop_codon:yes gene_type:complete
MGCNCKQTVTNFNGGDVVNPTTFLDCASADGTHDNPIAFDKVQCVAINNVLHIHNTFEINGTFKNSGTVYFTRDLEVTFGNNQTITILEI